VLLGVALGVYYGVRLLVRDAGAEPLRNSLSLLNLEAELHLDWEMALQKAFLAHLESVVHVLNFVYAWGYWLILGASLGYLYVRHRGVYRLLRNALFLSGFAGFFIFASFPVAPPRLADVGMIDTVRLAGSALEQMARPSALTNQNAAMPSLHFGWTLLCGIYLCKTQTRRIARALAISLPILMGLTIIVTGNHYVLDAVAGGVLCLLVLVPSVVRLHRLKQQPSGLQDA
jgi:membrane-associated phospholipid phosphatase